MQNPGAILAFTFRGDEAEATDSEDAAETEATEAEDATASAADTGAALTFTEAQAASGQQLYAANCASCHGQNLLAANYGPPLAGSFFAGRWEGRPVGELVDKVRTMPPSRPGQLPEEAYLDLTAHILAVNGYPAGEAELPSDPEALATIVIR
jgi:mono/diheme cytochrome c family protein